jgi:hypothetical protein
MGRCRTSGALGLFKVNKHRRFCSSCALTPWFSGWSTRTKAYRSTKKEIRTVRGFRHAQQSIVDAFSLARNGGEMKKPVGAVEHQRVGAFGIPHDLSS